MDIVSTLKIKNPLNKFLLRASGLYLLWLWASSTFLPGGSSIDYKLIKNLVYSSSVILNLIGFETFQEPDLIRIAGSSGVHIGPPCNALSLMILFAGFIAAFPVNWRSKLFIIPVGVLIIHILNLLRITALAIIQKFSPEWLEFNHSYTFTMIIYAAIFLMWMLWIKKNIKANHSN